MFDEIIDKLNKGKEKIQQSIIDRSITDEIVKDIDIVINEVHEIKNLDSVKTDIKNQIIRPVQKEISKGNKLSWLSIIASIGSLMLSIYIMFIQPDKIRESQESVVRNVLNNSNTYSNQNINALIYNENGMSGLVNRNGEKVTEAVYEEIQSAFEGYLKVKQFDLWGVISENGKLVIPASYLRIQPDYSNSIFSLQNSDGYFGVCGINQDTIVPFEFRSLIIWSLYNKITFSVNKKKYGIMNINGDIIKEAKFENVSIFSKDEYAYEDNGYWYVNSFNDKNIFKVKADYLQKQENQFGSFYTYGISNKVGVVTRNGTKIIPAKFKYVVKTKDHFDGYENNNNKVRFTHKGKCLIGCDYISE